MNDDEKHLAEYEKYKQELLEKIKKETNRQHKDWFENRLKSVKRRIQEVANVIKNG